MNFQVFLGTMYDDLVSKGILREQEHPKDLNEKVERLNNYLERLERVNKKAIEKEEYIHRLKKLYYDKYLIKEESIPASYWHHLEQKYLDNGYGKYNLVEPQTDEDRSLREGHITQIRNEQMDSLDSWLNYLMSPDSDYLPMWAKVWAFSGMQKIGNLNDDRTEYLRRSKTAVNPFVAIDSELLGKSVEYLKAYLNGEELPEEIKEHIKNKNFNQIYGYLLANKKEIKVQGDEGIWIKYLRERVEEIKRKEEKKEEPNYLKLYNSLQGYNTGWCTASSQATAKSQVLKGDFYVYYTKNENKEYVIPRIAIRMEGYSIGEIRGIAKDQNLEPNMEKALSRKLEEFPDKDKYLKKVRDMEMLTKIYNEYKTRELTKQELSFLYEIDEKILGFGFKADPRIQAILFGRSKQSDLATIFDCREDQISLTEETALAKNTVCHKGDINLENLKKLKRISLPKYILGTLDLKSLPILKNITFPEKISGNLDLSSVTSMKKVVLPKKIGGNLNLRSLTDIKNTTFPEEIGESLYLSVLTSLKGVALPKKIGGNLNLNSLTELRETSLPLEVGDSLHLDSLTELKGIKMPKRIGFNLYLDSLTHLEEVILPEEIGHSLSLKSLTSLKKVIFPKTINGSLNLWNLTTLEGVSFPENIGGTLYLPNIAFEDLQNIQLPKFGTIYLANNVYYTYEEYQTKLVEVKLANIKDEKEALLTEQQTLTEMKEIKGLQEVKEQEDGLKR